MNRKLILILISYWFIICSCKKDFLEIIDKTKLLREGYVIDLETTGHYMNGIYVEIASGFAGGNNLPLPELAADNIKPNVVLTSGIVPAVYRWSASNDFDVAGPWYNNYRIIRACNFVLEKAEQFKNQNVTKANSLKGEALAIRAWIYFYTVNSFAQSYNFTSDASHMGVPYVRTSDIQEPVKRETVKQVYDAMISDLNESLRLLPSTVTDKQYMNYQAVKALLARIYLFMEDFAAAKNLATQVLNDVPLMKVNYPANFYKTTETEALFRLPPGDSKTSDYSTVFIGDSYNKTSGRITLFATNDIALLYRSHSADKRNAWVRDSTIGRIVTKFPRGVTGTHSLPAADYYQTLFRSTEMALTAAEAFAEINNEDSARFFINEIRVRAGVPALTSSISGTALMDSIKLERRKEMAFDGIRMFDLLRWKQGVVRQDALSPAYQTLTYPNNKAIFPLPKSDVQIAGLPQNPGY